MVGSSNARHLERLSGLRGRRRTFKAAELRWARQLLTRPAEALRLRGFRRPDENVAPILARFSPSPDASKTFGRLRDGPAVSSQIGIAQCPARSVRPYRAGRRAGDRLSPASPRTLAEQYPASVRPDEPDTEPAGRRHYSSAPSGSRPDTAAGHCFLSAQCPALHVRRTPGRRREAPTSIVMNCAL